MFVFALTLTASCAMPNERGPCSNYSVKWYFDPSYGDCTRFWYGGCDGNGNRFDNKEDCRAQCVKVEGLSMYKLHVITGDP